MKPLLLGFAALLVGAAPPVIDTPIGHFLTWGGLSGAPLHFRSGGLEVSVVALPCPPKPLDDRGCSATGVNNQARITVTAPGLPPFAMTSDPSADVVGIAVGRLNRRSSRAGVVIDNAWLGTLGINTVQFLEPTTDGFRAVPLRDRTGNVEIAGDVSTFPLDVNGDGIVDLVMEDVGFAYVFGCGACTPRPPVILSVVGGRGVDLSADASTRVVFVKDMIRPRAVCRSRQDDRNGNCAAYVADAARLGRFDEAWRDMLDHYQRHDQWGVWQGCTVRRDRGPCPPGAETHYRNFPESLRAFLVFAGYIAPAQAAAAPLS